MPELSGSFDGKVVFITGVARGQGRSHAVRLAEEGADVVGVDSLTDVGAAPYPMSRQADLDETQRLVEAAGGRAVLLQADVRDQSQLDAAVARGLEQLGRIDFVLCNAGIAGYGKGWEMSEQTWSETIDINLSGVWRTIKATTPTMIEQGEGGAIVITSSIMGLIAMANVSHYVASKHAVVGLAKALAQELSEHRIRVNTVNPTSVRTPIIENRPTIELFNPETPDPEDLETADEQFRAMHLMPTPWLEPVEVSDAIVYLLSDAARNVTGISLPVDAGAIAKGW